MAKIINLKQRTKKMIEELEKKNQVGIKNRIKGNYESSLQEFEKIKQEVQEVFGYTSQEYAAILNNMGGTYRMMREFEKAEACYLDAISIYKELEECFLRDFVQLYGNLTILCCYSGWKEKGLKYEKMVMEYFEQCKEEKCAKFPALLNSVGGFLLYMGEYQEALEVYKKTSMYTKRFFAKNLDYGNAVYSMAEVYRKLGRQEEARLSMEEAWEIYEKIYGKDHERTLAVGEELKRWERNDKNGK